MSQIYNQFNQRVAADVHDWQGAKRPKKTIMTGRTIHLEIFNSAKHTAPLFESLSQNNPGDTWTYLPYGPFVNVDDFSAWLMQTQALQDTQLYVLTAPDTRVPLGLAGYLRITPEHGTIEIGHLHYAKVLQRTPASTEAMFLMMQYAFDELGYRRYEWKCNHLNEPSRQAALRLGFTFEGTFRQHFVYKGQNRDTDWFSILDSEWPAIKAALTRWLAPDNFDIDGSQRQRLQDMR